MIRQAFILLLLLGTICSVTAQSYTYGQKSLIHYKDGSVFIGSVVSMSNNNLRVKITTGDTITIRSAMIKRYIPAKDIIIYRSGRHHYKSGIFALLSVGTSLFDDIATQVELTLANRMLQNCALGITGGINAYETYHGGLYFYNEFYSIAGFARYYLNERKARLFTDLRLGYGFANTTWIFNESYSDGVNGQAGIGILLPSKNKFRWSFSLIGSTQFTKGESRDFGPFQMPIETDYKLWLNRAFLKIGLEFN